MRSTWYEAFKQGHATVPGKAFPVTASALGPDPTTTALRPRGAAALLTVLARPARGCTDWCRWRRSLSRSRRCAMAWSTPMLRPRPAMAP